MLFSDEYTVPVSEEKENLREKGSKFLAYLFPVLTEQEIKEKIQELKVKYPDATHHCYAWILHPDKSAQRANDDGEPAGSAGKPILRTILSADLTNILIVVVRYFGGTQLGIPGLIQAYSDSARLVLEKCKKQSKKILIHFEISTNFENENEIHRLLKTFHGIVTQTNYNHAVFYRVGIPQSLADGFFAKAKLNHHLAIKRV